MSSEDGDVYIMHEGDDDEEWVSPTPAREAIVDVIGEESDLDAEDLDIDEFVDWDELRSVLEDGDDSLEFDVEDVSVTVDGAGDIAVE